MKTKDLKNLIGKTAKELENQVADLSKQLEAIDVQLRGRRLKNTNAGKNIKRSIAQLKSLIRAKQLSNENN